MPMAGREGCKKTSQADSTIRLAKACGFSLKQDKSGYILQARGKSFRLKHLADVAAKIHSERKRRAA